jgi:hypothetical protein
MMTIKKYTFLAGPISIGEYTIHKYFLTPLLLPLLMVGCDGTPIVDVSSSETATQSSQVVIK